MKESLKDYIFRIVVTSTLTLIATMMVLFCLSSCSKPRHYNPRLDGYSVGQELGGYCSCKKCGI